MELEIHNAKNNTFEVIPREYKAVCWLLSKTAGSYKDNKFIFNGGKLQDLIISFERAGGTIIYNN